MAATVTFSGEDIQEVIDLIDELTGMIGRDEVDCSDCDEIDCPEHPDYVQVRPTPEQWHPQRLAYNAEKDLAETLHNLGAKLVYEDDQSAAFAIDTPMTELQVQELRQAAWNYRSSLEPIGGNEWKLKRLYNES